MAEPKPFLVFGDPVIHDHTGSGFSPSGPAFPDAKAQGRRLAPKFNLLLEAFDKCRIQVSEGEFSETDPALVVVLELANSVYEFYKEVAKIDGLEFLAEFDNQGFEDEVPEEISSHKDKTSKDNRSIYFVMSNRCALEQLIRLFHQWKEDPSFEFERGLTKFRDLFQELEDIRQWGPEDRLREIGALNEWKSEVEDPWASRQFERVEIELWYRSSKKDQLEAETRVREAVAKSKGTVLSDCIIPEINYHALLVELPITVIDSITKGEWENISLFHSDAIMYISPFIPMSVDIDQTTNEEWEKYLNRISYKGDPLDTLSDKKPRIALLDGLPLQGHRALVNRLRIDDPDDFGRDYPVKARRHGTAMASLIIHGDLSEHGRPLDRPIYVRPIMKPDPPGSDSERGVSNQLIVDLIHRAVRRIVEGEDNEPASEPTVRIINLSYGIPTRVLSRRMSPLGHLLDWLATTYRLLFIVSAGNHKTLVGKDQAELQDSVFKQRYGMNTAMYGVLPPGDAMNALTVGAIQKGGTEHTFSGMTDTAFLGGPAFYSANGPGVGRSIKPDIFYPGGRQVAYINEFFNCQTFCRGVTLFDEPLPPGIQVASPPSQPGQLDGQFALPIEVTCANSRPWQEPTLVPYALIASVETEARTSKTIYDEVRQGLRGAPARERLRVQYLD